MNRQLRIHADRCAQAKNYTMNEISLILGAGFSANKGYPTGNVINDKILKLTPDDFSIYSDQSVHFKTRDEEDPNWHSEESKIKEFVVNLISLFNVQNGGFDYEKFYDYYHDIYIGNKVVLELNKLCKSFNKKYKFHYTAHDLLSHTNRIFNQLIALCLVDSKGRQYYDPVHYSGPIYPGYTGFLNCIKKWGETNIVHLHTLNHDIFLESLASSDWIQGKLSDGFSEMGSSYYGNYRELYKVRLPYFNNRYVGNYRLYKLHGSIDQYPFRIMRKGVDSYVKAKYGVGTSELFKEVRNFKLKHSYISDWIEFHPDFLTGTTSKIIRYREPWYYKKIFKHFVSNLSKSKSLIIIGYGGADDETNRLIHKKYKFEKYPAYIIDPFPHDRTISLAGLINAKIITKDPDNMDINDFD